MSDRRTLDLTPIDSRQETPYPPMAAIPEVRTGRSGKPIGRRKVVPADLAPGRLDADQVAEFRRRLDRGFYNSPAVQREVARRLLESGDL